MRPYAFDFVCHVKQRQAGLDVVEAFAREFPGRPRSYYEEARRRGLLRVERAAPAKNKPPGPGKTRDAGKRNDSRKRARRAAERDVSGSAAATTTRDDTKKSERPNPGNPGGCRATDATEPATEQAAFVATPSSRNLESESRRPSPEVEPLRPLAAGERVRHYLHRHEPPTLSDPVTVLAVTDSMVAVHKPATVPVHPTGQYRKNTVLGLMAASRPDLGRLLPVHRLDKNVSGLLLMARDSASANRLREEVQSLSVRKRYVALVSSANLATGKHILETFSARDEDGEPKNKETLRLESAVVDVGLRYDPRARLATCCARSTDVDVAETAETTGGLPPVKDARTAFALVAVSAADAFAEDVFRTESRTTGNKVFASRGVPRGAALVACEPLTGRTHQIRAHLKHLGHPILNDARYGGVLEADRAATRALLATCRATRADAFFPEDEEKEEKDPPSRRWPLCPHCPMMAHGANDDDEGDAGGSGARAEDLERLYLHCAEYRGAAWAFACPSPSWVPEECEEEKPLARLLDDAYSESRDE